MRQAPEMFESSNDGLFIVTEHGIFRYDAGCFKKVKICDEDGVEMRIGTVRDKPGQQGES